MLEKIFQSSQNPEEISLLVKGVMAIIVPVAGFVVVLTGKQIDVSSVQQIVTGLGTVVVAVGGVVSSVMMLWGLIRKFIPSSVAPTPTAVVTP